jgi:2-oxoisovalerate dehydrogenase E1 component
VSHFAGELSARTAYARMRFIRGFEDLVLDLRADGEISGSVHTCQGQEAPPIALCAALQPDDRVVATYRGHGWALARGVPPASVLAEILGRRTGTNGGRGGSAFLSAPSFGFLGENSIVGAGLPVANGVALALQKHAGVVVVSFGDGATNQGAAHEALVLAVAKRLPVVFVCENNGWSEMTPIEATVPVGLADRARGYGIAADVADGSDVMAVARVGHTAVERARRGDGPTFLELRVGRLGGHYNADPEHYRSPEDRAAAARLDPLARLRAGLGSDVAAQADAEVERLLEASLLGARGAPEPDPATARQHVAGDLPVPARRAPEQRGPQPMTYQKAVNAALERALRDDPSTLLFGEDVAVPGGVFGATKGLLEAFGPDRVFDTPISEAAILGAALGASLTGRRPIVEIMWADFLLVALDQLVNQAANVRYLAQGAASAPFVVRTQQGATPGSCAQHCQSLEALLAHVPGLRVGLPATPQDAHDMLLAAVACDDPAILIESRLLYATKEPVELQGPGPDVWRARLRRPGTDVTIVSWGRMANTCVEAADAIAEQGVSASVLDLRWLSPLDFDAVRAELSRHGRIVIVHEANRTGGFGAEIASRVAEELFADLDAPPTRVALPDVRVPASPVLQAALVPDVQQIAAAARRLIGAGDVPVATASRH